MLNMLKQVGRPEMVVGWYHSHPNFGCWLSSTDVETQKSFENLHCKAVAIVIDPIQSVKGKVVIDAFRTLPGVEIVSGHFVRQNISNFGQLKKPTTQAISNGLNRDYYSITMNYSNDTSEEKMLKFYENE